MELAALRNALNRRPFQPFHIVLNTGEKVSIPHPEFVSFPPQTKSPETLMTWDAQVAPLWLDIASITAIDFRSKVSKPRGRKR